MTRKKKLSVVLFAVLLCFILACSLAACVDDTQQGEDKTHNETVKPFIDEVSKALSNSISADLQNGFYAGYAGSVKIGADEYTFDFDANILSKEKEGEEEANNNFRLVVKKGEAVLFGLYNDKTNLYLEQGENKYHFENASVMKALRSVLVLNVPALNELTNLDAVEVMGTDLKSFIESTMPLVFSILCEDPDAEADKNLMVEKKDNVYSLTMDLTNISSLVGALGVGDLNLSFLKGIEVKLDLTVANDAVKTIGVSLNVGETNYAVNVTSKSDGGLFGAVKDDLDAQVPEALKAVGASSVIQTDFAGKINVNVKTKDGSAVLKTMDWKLVSKIDLFELVDNNFMFSKLPDGNFFHLQISHKCDDKCASYCSTNLISAMSGVLGNRFKNTSILDIAWDPSTMETNNIFVDVSLWDLLTVQGLESLLTDATGMSLKSLASAGSALISSQIVLSVDPDTVLLGDDTVARTVEGGSQEGGSQAANASAGFNLDVMKLLTSLTGLGSIANNELTVNIDGVKNLVAAIAGDAPIAGKLTIAKALDYAFDTAKGVGGFTFTIDKNSFGHNAVVAEYDTYTNAVKMNANGQPKVKAYGDGDVTPYGGNDFGGKTPIIGSPALATKGVTMTDGFLNIYAKDADGKFVLVADNANVLTNYDLEVLYGGMKNLYFEYSYLDFNKQIKKAYGSIFGFNGLDLNKTGEQAVTLLASPMTGESISATIQKNLMPLLESFNVSLDFDLNLEKLIPIVADPFAVKVNFDAAYMPENVEFVKDNLSDYKAVYQVNDTLETKAHVEFNVGAKRYSFPLNASDSVEKDVFGLSKPGEYTVTYSIADKYRVTFKDGANTVTETITIDNFALLKFEQNSEIKFTVENNAGLKDKTFGTATYTLKDGTTVTKSVKWKDVYNKLFVNDGKGEFAFINDDNVAFTEAGQYTLKLRYSDTVVLGWKINVAGIQSITAQASTDLKLYQGDNLLMEAGKNTIKENPILTIKVKYTDNSEKSIAYSWGVYYKEFTITDANGSSENVRAEYENLAFLSGGTYTFAITYGGKEYKVEYAVAAIESVTPKYNKDLLITTEPVNITGSNGSDWWFVKLDVTYTGSVSRTITYTWLDSMNLYTVTNKATGGGTFQDGIRELKTNKIAFSQAGTYVFAIVFNNVQYAAEVQVYDPVVTYENAGVIPAKIGLTSKISFLDDNGYAKVFVKKIFTFGEDYAALHDGKTQVVKEVKYAEWMNRYFKVTKDGKVSGSIDNSAITFNSAGIHTVTYKYAFEQIDVSWTVEVVAPISASEEFKDYNGVFTVGVARDCMEDVLYSLNNVYEDTSLNEKKSITFYEATLLEGENAFMIFTGDYGMTSTDDVTITTNDYYMNTVVTFKKAGDYIFFWGGKYSIAFTVAAAQA